MNPDASQGDDRIARAMSALNAAPDIGRGEPTKREIRAIVDANMRAWIILAEGMHPPSKRHVPEGMQDAG